MYNVTLSGDIAASARYYVRDVVAPDFVLHADGTPGVPTAPGIGVAPDPAALAAVTER